MTTRKQKAKPRSGTKSATAKTPVSRRRKNVDVSVDELRRAVAGFMLFASGYEDHLSDEQRARRTLPLRRVLDAISKLLAEENKAHQRWELAIQVLAWADGARTVDASIEGDQDLVTERLLLGQAASVPSKTGAGGPSRARNPGPKQAGTSQSARTRKPGRRLRGQRQGLIPIVEEVAFSDVEPEAPIAGRLFLAKRALAAAGREALRHPKINDNDANDELVDDETIETWAAERDPRQLEPRAFAMAKIARSLRVSVSRLEQLQKQGLNEGTARTFVDNSVDAQDSKDLEAYAARLPPPPEAWPTPPRGQVPGRRSRKAH